MNPAQRLLSASASYQDRMSSWKEAPSRIILADDMCAAVSSEGRVVNLIPTESLRVWKRKLPKTGADLLWTYAKKASVLDYRGSCLSEALEDAGLPEGEVEAYLAYEAGVVHSPLSAF